ncbi:MAG: Flp pilus assembly complex ATPase component TadA [Clostridia bacterium]|nr:Flp pilus assembly complex ATPase component TadA [Clostridia bacterium]
MIKDVLSILPLKILNVMKDLDVDNITEIRLRNNQNICFKFGNLEVVKDYKISTKDIEEILVKVSGYSIYSIQNSINEGYITAPGGNRIGIVGEAVVIDNKIKNFKNISSMNIRISREIKGCANGVISKAYDDFGNLKNILIVSPPGCGKTTFLRDLIRQLSNKGANVGLVDERGEVSCNYMGNSTLDVGTRTDVISFIQKTVGISMLIRSMGLDVVALDEIGSRDDILAIKHATQCGVKVIATIHGDESIIKNNKTLGKGYFDLVIILEKIGKVKKIINLNEEFKESIFNG